MDIIRYKKGERVPQDIIEFTHNDEYHKCKFGVDMVLIDNILYPVKQLINGESIFILDKIRSCKIIKEYRTTPYDYNVINKDTIINDKLKEHEKWIKNI